MDISPFLQKGENVIAVQAWYWGNAGRNNIDCGEGGLLFACESLGIYSDNTWKMLAQPAQAAVSEPYSLILYGGHDIGYDARKELEGWMKVNFSDTAWPYAIERGKLPELPWGNTAVRSIPLHRFSKVLSYKNIRRHGNKYIGILPYGAQITPYLKVKAPAGLTIDIRTDRYTVRGGPGWTNHFYTFQKTEYTTKEDEQEFESLNWVYGEKVIYMIPDGVEVLRLGYRESGYDTDIISDFTCSDVKINKLVQKSARTLYVCMRDNFMDCPDRERGQWIGDLCVQAPQIFYCMDRRADLLPKKAVYDIINFRRGKIVVGLVPGIESNELPGQNLSAVSSLGFAAEYYNHTGDKSVLDIIYEPFCDYLKVWDMNFEQGKIIKRLCDWYWLDHGDVIDSEILENCWYYLAVGHVKSIAAILDKTFDAELNNRSESIKTHFQNNYRRDDGFRSGNFLDDRANALAVLCDFVKTDQYEIVLSIFKNIYYSTPFMEYYVETAMMKLGFEHKAMERMRMRYNPLIDNEDSTLWEDFTLLGTHNHAWSGGPMTILHKYGCGLMPLKSGFEELAVLPRELSISNLHAHIDTPFGEAGSEVNISIYQFQVTAFAPQGMPVLIGIPKKWFKDHAPCLFLNNCLVEDYLTLDFHYAVKTIGRTIELIGKKY